MSALASDGPDSLAYQIVFLTAQTQMPDAVALAFFGIAAGVRRLEVTLDEIVQDARAAVRNDAANVVRVDFVRKGK